MLDSKEFTLKPDDLIISEYGESVTINSKTLAKRLKQLANEAEQNMPDDGMPTLGISA
jgi:hypothetical protein